MGGGVSLGCAGEPSQHVHQSDDIQSTRKELENTALCGYLCIVPGVPMQGQRIEPQVYGL